MRLVWSPRSRDDLLAIERFNTQYRSAEYAQHVLEHVRESARRLLTAPRLGQKVQPENRDDLRRIVASPCWVYYRIRDDAIEVITVAHFRQQTPTTG